MEKIRKFLIRTLIVMLLWLHADVTPIITNHGKNHTNDDENMFI